MASSRLCILAVAVCLFMTLTYGARIKKIEKPEQSLPAEDIVKPEQNPPAEDIVKPEQNPSANDTVKPEQNPSANDTVKPGQNPSANDTVNPMPNLPAPPRGFPMNRPMKVKFSLAKSYGKLNSTSLKNLDEALKVMIGGVLRINFNKAYTWPSLIKTLKNCKYMLHDKKKSVSKIKKLNFRDTKVFGIHGNKRKREYQIKAWFTNLIGNADILKDTKIRLQKVIDMVAKHNLDMIHHLFKRNIHTMGMLDAGILRFPDVSQPYFSVYRITLVAKRTYHTYLFHQIETSAVVGTFHKEIFLPNEKYIYSLTDNLMEKLVDEANHFFDF